MAIFNRIRNLFHRVDVNRAIDEELQAHIDLSVEAKTRDGLPHVEARREALLRFGNPVSTRERVVAVDTALGIDRFWADIRYAWRKLIKSPGFFLTAALTLAIGIGANTAIFSSMDAVVLRPLAVPAMDRVLTIAERQDSMGDENVSLADYEDWVRRNRSFEELSVRLGVDMSLTGAGDAAHVQIEMASANFFSVLRVQPLLGRLFVADECVAGRDTVAVLNYGFWQRRFASDPSVIGRRVMLDQRSYTIVGVLPKSVQYPSIADIFVPLAPTPQQLANRGDHSYYMVEGRLRDGVTVKQAQADLRDIAAQLAQTYPATNRGWTVHAEPLLDTINGDLTPLYYRLLMGATLFVLLVVCANVANLQFARGIERRTEIAMRTALGASRTRVLRQLLTENILLSLIGAGGGLVLGWLYLRLTLVFMPERVARHMSGWSNISLNGRAFALSLLLAIVAGLVSGLAPSFEALRINLADQLKAGSRSTIGGRRRWLRNAFAVTQVAFAVALVIGAALMTKGMTAQLHIADAYQPEKVLTFSVALPEKRFDTQKQVAWYSDSLTKLRALPGVTHAVVTNALPYSDYGWNRELQIENRPAALGKNQNALNVIVSPDYFSAFHIAITAGRGFAPGDSLESTPVAVVSRRFVAQYLNGLNPIGHRIRMGRGDSSDPWVTIVGIADEAKYTLWDQNEYSVVYLDDAQYPSPTTAYAVMTDGDPLALAESARKALASIDPTIPLDSLMTYRNQLNDNLIGLMYASGMIGLDALIALFLAAIGIFGVMANVVGEQTREIGVRLAMGARREDVLTMMLRRASHLTAIGLGVGLVLAFALARMVANLLRGVRPDDPVVFVGISVAIVVIALTSSFIPARRASRVDPMQALRSE